MMILVACLWREGDKLIIQSIIHFSIEGNFGKVLTDFVCHFCLLCFTAIA